MGSTVQQTQGSVNTAIPSARCLFPERAGAAAILPSPILRPSLEKRDQRSHNSGQDPYPEGPVPGTTPPSPIQGTGLDCLNKAMNYEVFHRDAPQ